MTILMRSAFGLMLVLPLAVGCRGLESGKTDWVQPTSDKSRAGNVYLIRGLVGVFSTGMDDLAQQLNERGVRSHVFQDSQNAQLGDAIIATYQNVPNPEPLVLIGHSYGADGVVRVSRHIAEKGIKVDLLVTIDATIPPNVPTNVALCYNIYQPQPTDFIPLFRGVPLKQDPGGTGKLVNMDIRKDRKDLLEPGTNHVNIDKNSKVHQALIQYVLEACPERSQWLARHGQASPSTAKPAGQ